MDETRLRWRARKPGTEPAALWRPDLVGDDVLAAMPAEGILRDYVCWAVQETYAPPIFHLASILPAWAWTVTRWGWHLPVRGAQGALQSFLIGPPASAKSTCVRLAIAFHEEFLEEWDSDERTPWLQAEGTVAGLLEHLSDRYEDEVEITPAILFHEEVSSLLDGGGAVVDIMMQLFDACPKVERQLVRYREARRRGEKPPNCVVRPAVGGVFCATPRSAADTLTERHFDGGLVSRSLWLTGEAAVERYFTAGPAPIARREVLRRWTHHARSLPALGARGGGKIVRENAVFKGVFDWTLFPRFQQANQAGRESEAATLGRAMGQARTIAGLYALSCGRLEVIEADVRAAVKLVEMSLANTLVLQGRAAESELYRAVERAEALIRRAGAEGLNRTDLNRGHLRLPKALYDQVVAQLEEERGIVAVKRPPTGGSRGRPLTVFVAEDLLDGPIDGGVVIRLPTKYTPD